MKIAFQDIEIDEPASVLLPDMNLEEVQISLSLLYTGNYTGKLESELIPDRVQRVSSILDTLQIKGWAELRSTVKLQFSGLGRSAAKYPLFWSCPQILPPVSPPPEKPRAHPPCNHAALSLKNPRFFLV